MAKARNQAPWRIYFYVPNLIGYARILANILAFKVCFTEKRFFTALYFISFVCDELDGRFARLLNQASTFGAVLDMVTDSSFLSNKTSHKDVTDNKSWLMRMYYKHRIFMGYCCVSTEVLYLVLYLMSQNESVSVVKVFIAALNEKSLLSCLGLAALPGWATKQIINLVQMKTAADTCVFYDIQRNKKP
eukprot:TRINITY_DN20806_c0_g1_i1.p1 TRINITY_DN20806_c0_g1~~TRINITY_DN20806_c0_g1_i1.p1  ORF type:complete len:189 (+),score=13.34 TRINITY_DN20806_c0_g1_i1:278-844(+)